MSYSPTTDFIELLRQTSGGLRPVRMPGLDYVVAALSRAGLVTLSVGPTAPIANQTSTVWFKPSVPSTIAEGAVYLWNALTNQYEPATPALWAALFSFVATTIVQDVTTVGPVAIANNAQVVRVQNVGAPVTLVMPASVAKQGAVLVVDWANNAGTNPITINTAAGETFQLAKASWQIGADGGSVSLRPVPGGYAI